MNNLNDLSKYLDVSFQEFGAQNLAGSGFENEIPDAEFAESQEAIEDGRRQ